MVVHCLLAKALLGRGVIAMQKDPRKPANPVEPKRGVRPRDP
jgi:hypothetical protein